MKLNITNITKFNGLKVIHGLRFKDTRGYFREIHKKHIINAIKFYGNCNYSNYLKKLISK